MRKQNPHLSAKKQRALATTESEKRKIDVRFWDWISRAGKNGLTGLAKILTYPDKRDNLEYFPRAVQAGVPWSIAGLIDD
jgi:hypothetical protein